MRMRRRKVCEGSREPQNLRRAGRPAWRGLYPERTRESIRNVPDLMSEIRCTRNPVTFCECSNLITEARFY
jgi:hypothetical protein